MMPIKPAKTPSVIWLPLMGSSGSGLPSAAAVNGGPSLNSMA